MESPLRVRSLLLFAAVAALAPSAIYAAAPSWSAALIPGSRTRLARLDNGLSVIITSDPRLKTAALALWVRAGGTQERPGHSGVAHLFEHMMFRPQAPGQPSFNELIAEDGSEANAFTLARATVFVAELRPEALERQLGLEAARFTHGWIDEDVFRTEKGAVRSELADSYAAPTLPALAMDLRRHAFGAQPASHGAPGRLEDLDGLSLEDCRAFFAARYVPSNCAVILAGPLGFDEALGRVAAAFGAWEGPAAPAQAEPDSFKAGDLGEAGHPLPYPGLMVGLRNPGLGLRPGSAEDLAVHILFYSPWNLAARSLKVEKHLLNFLMPFGMAEDGDLLLCWLSADPGVKAGPVVAGLQALPETLAALGAEPFGRYREEWRLGYREALLAPATLNWRLGQAWSRGGLDELAALLEGGALPDQAAVAAAARRLLAPGSLAYVRTGMAP